MQARIQGTTMPVLEVELEPNESVFSESGELSWMTGSIQMMTHTQMGGGGGLFGVLKRVAGGGSIFMTEYRAMQVSRRGQLCHQGAGPHCPRAAGPGAGVHGAPPWIFVRHDAGNHRRRLSAVAGRRHLWRRRIPAAEGGWRGTAWLELSGELIVKDLAPGEVLRVHPGHVGAFQTSVGFQITMVPGIKNMIFGGDGLFLAELVGPGSVWLQTLPISRLAHQISEYLPQQEARPDDRGRHWRRTAGRHCGLDPERRPVGKTTFSCQFSVSEACDWALSAGAYSHTLATGHFARDD